MIESKKVLIVFGARPEAIKMAPVVKGFQAAVPHIQTVVCVTAQHREMLDQVLKLFSITPEYDLDVMKPSPGVRGHCIAVYLWFIVSSAPAQARLIKTAREVNDAKSYRIIDKVKANIDDMCEFPSLDIVKELQTQNVGKIMVCDPNVQAGKVSFPLVNLKQVLKEADILLLVDHTGFKEIDLDTIKDKVVIDTRGVLR